MAYSTFPQPAQPMIPAPPQAGISPLRPVPGSQVPAGRALRRAETSESATASTSGLLRFLILLAIICGLTCLYVWQANTISAIRDETQSLNAEVQVLERRNIDLMLEYAGWDRPDYIEAQSRQAGMVAGQIPVRVRLPELGEDRTVASTATEYSLRTGQLAAWVAASPMIWSQPK
jgi:hypothetical protein